MHCRLFQRDIHDWLGLMPSLLRYDITIVIAAVWCSALVEPTWFVTRIFHNKSWTGSVSCASKHRSIARAWCSMTRQNETFRGDRVTFYGPMGLHRICRFSKKCFDTLERNLETHAIRLIEQSPRVWFEMVWTWLPILHLACNISWRSADLLHWMVLCLVKYREHSQRSGEMVCSKWDGCTELVLFFYRVQPYDWLYTSHAVTSLR